MTRSDALPQFSAAKARTFLQLIADHAEPLNLPEQAESILRDYREFLKEAGWESES